MSRGGRAGVGAQALVNVLARRPAVDLGRPYLAESYSAAIVAVQMEAGLLREVVAAQVRGEAMRRERRRGSWGV